MSAPPAAASETTRRSPAAPAPERRGLITYGFVKRASFTHSALYFCLLVAWAVPGDHWTETVFGYGHGLGWFGMVGLSLAALRRRVVPLPLAALVSIGGAIGPFLGSAAFLLRDRRRAKVH